MPRKKKLVIQEDGRMAKGNVANPDGNPKLADKSFLLYRAGIQQAQIEFLTKDKLTNLLQIGYEIACDTSHPKWDVVWKEMVNRAAGKLNQGVEVEKKEDPRTAIINVLNSFGLPVESTRAYPDTIRKDFIDSGLVTEQGISTLPDAVDLRPETSGDSGEG